MKTNRFTDWLKELELLIEKHATPDIRADYPSMTIDDKQRLYVRLSKIDSER